MARGLNGLTGRFRGHEEEPSPAECEVESAATVALLDTEKGGDSRRGQAPGSGMLSVA